MRARLPLIAATAALSVNSLVSFHRDGIGLSRYRIDLDVYRIGSRVWLQGGNLYGALPKTRAGLGLPFTYPPAAAVLLSPLTVVPMAVAGFALTLASIALTGVVLRVFTRSLSFRLSLWWLLPAALALEPVRATLSFGQVNIVLMAMVAADCLHPRPRWPRGVLVGVAAAVKLTPLAFILFFLIRNDSRSARTAALSFAVTTGAGFIFAGHDSARYWTSVIFDTSRPGSPAYVSNQALSGVLARAGLDPHSHGGTLVWLALSVAVIAIAVAGMRRALAVGEPALALSLNALAALLISPISWSHHWVWAAPALLCLAVTGRRHSWRAGTVAAGAGLVLFVVSPIWLLPHAGGSGAGHLGWAWWEQLIGDSYVVFGVAVLALAALKSALVPRRPPSTPPAPALVLRRTPLSPPTPAPESSPTPSDLPVRLPSPPGSAPKPPQTPQILEHTLANGELCTRYACNIHHWRARATCRRGTVGRRPAGAPAASARNVRHVRDAGPMNDDAAPRSRLRSFSPVFPVRDMRRALAHYTALGFAVEPYADGDEYGFAERDEVSLHLSLDEGHGPEADHEHVGTAYLHVDDADALYEEWARPGTGGLTRGVGDTPYKLREGSHVDPDGNLIRFGSPLPGRPAERLRAHLQTRYGIAAEGMTELDLGVWRVRRADGPDWVARWFPARRAANAVAGDAAILRRLAAHEFPAERCAADEPVSDLDGRSVLVTEWADPVPRPQRRDAIRAAGGLRQLGALLGRLHALGTEPGAPADSTGDAGDSAVARPGGAWHHLADGLPSAEIAAASRMLAESAPVIPDAERAAFDALRAEVDALDAGEGLPEGLIHPDFVLANVVATTDGMVLVDWAGAGRGPRLWPLAFLLYAEAAKDPRRAGAVLLGYREHVTLEVAELDRLAAVARSRPLILSAWSVCMGRTTPTDAMTAAAETKALAETIATRARAVMTGP